MKRKKLAYILRSEGLLPRVAGILGGVVPEGEVNFGRPIRVEGGVYHSAHYRVDHADGLYLELYSDFSPRIETPRSPTLYGHVRYNAFEGGSLSPREVAEELHEELEGGTMPVMFEGQRWET